MQSAVSNCRFLTLLSFKPKLSPRKTSPGRCGRRFTLLVQPSRFRCRQPAISLLSRGSRILTWVQGWGWHQWRERSRLNGAPGARKRPDSTPGGARSRASPGRTHGRPRADKDRSFCDWASPHADPARARDTHSEVPASSDGVRMVCLCLSRWYRSIPRRLLAAAFLWLDWHHCRLCLLIDA